MAKSKRTYSRTDSITALLVLLSAWCYVWGFTTLGSWRWVIFAVVYIGTGFFYSKVNRRKILKESYFYATLVLVSGIFLMMTDRYQKTGAYHRIRGYEMTAGFEFPLLIFYHGFGVYYILTLLQNRIDGSLSENGVRDMIRGVFKIPFSHIHCLAQMLLYKIEEIVYGGRSKEQSEGQDKEQDQGRDQNLGKEKQYSGRFIQLVLGLGIGALILLMVIPMLMRADKTFASFVTWTFGNVSEFGDFLHLIFNGRNFVMLIVASYLFGLLYGADKSKVPVLKKREPGLTTAAITCLVMVCGLYLLFFGVKAADAITTVSGGAGSFIYSAYAREGFFDLSGVAFVNLLLYFLIRMMANWQGGKIKVLQTLLGIETLAFIVLGFYKMMLYIGKYGYTFLRVFTSWFMVTLFVCFSLLLVKSWRKFNAVRWSVWFGAVSFLVVVSVFCY